MAMDIYKSKKEDLQKGLLESLTKHSKIKDEGAIQQVADTIISKFIVNGEQLSKQAERNAKQYFDNVSIKLGEYLSRDNISFVEAFEASLKGAEESKKTAKDNPQTYTKLFINRLETQMKRHADLWTAYQKALKEAGYVFEIDGNSVKKKNKVIVAQRNSYIQRVVIQDIAKQLVGKNGDTGSILGQMFDINKNAYIQAVKGEYYERGIVDILSKQIAPELKRVGYSGNRAKNFVIQSGGFKDQKGHSIKEDILFNLDLGANLAAIEKNFLKTKSYQTAIPVDDKPIKEVSKTAITNFAAAQIKSFKLPKQQLNHTRYFPLGGAQELYSRFVSDALFQWGLVGSIAFLGRAKNIVAAIGENNILFATGNGTQWTYDFIKDFRDLHFYLQFEQYKDKNDEVAFKKEIGLYNYAAAKSHLDDYKYQNI